jgi:hypothetical protein
MDRKVIKMELGSKKEWWALRFLVLSWVWGCFMIQDYAWIPAIKWTIILASLDFIITMLFLRIRNKMLSR